jgi:hypothetical protein
MNRILASAVPIGPSRTAMRLLGLATVTGSASIVASLGARDEAHP